MLNPKETRTIRVETSALQELVEDAPSPELLVDEIENVRRQVEEGLTPEDAINQLWVRGRQLQERGDIDGGAAIIDRHFDIWGAFEDGDLDFREEIVTDRKRQIQRIGASVLAGLTIWGAATYGPNIVNEIVRADNAHFMEEYVPAENQ